MQTKFHTEMLFLSISVWSYNNDWLIEQGLTSHQTHYRSYQGRFLQIKAVSKH